jgi:hypothetical protein
MVLLFSFTTPVGIIIGVLFQNKELFTAIFYSFTAGSTFYIQEPFCTSPLLISLQRSLVSAKKNGPNYSFFYSAIPLWPF